MWIATVPAGIHFFQVALLIFSVIRPTIFSYFFLEKLWSSLSLLSYNLLAELSYYAPQLNFMTLGGHHHHHHHQLQPAMPQISLLGLQLPQASLQQQDKLEDKTAAVMPSISGKLAADVMPSISGKLAAAVIS